jgi:hypothetical protein
MLALISWRYPSPCRNAAITLLQTRLDEFRAQHIRGAIISLPLESSIAERLVKENPDIACLFDVSPETEVSCVRFDHRDGCGACSASLGTRPSRIWPAGRSGKLGLRPMRLGCWRRHCIVWGKPGRDGISATGAASGWQKPLSCFICSRGSAPSSWPMTRWH